jgi:hypothetical protein
MDTDTYTGEDDGYDEYMAAYQEAEEDVESEIVSELRAGTALIMGPEATVPGLAPDTGSSDWTYRLAHQQLNGEPIIWVYIYHYGGSDIGVPADADVDGLDAVWYARRLYVPDAPVDTPEEAQEQLDAFARYVTAHPDQFK